MVTTSGRRVGVSPGGGRGVGVGVGVWANGPHLGWKVVHVTFSARSSARV